MEHSRLDILLYAHDGRGLGHVSRSAAIGLALKRIAPGLKTCLVTGCRQTQELIGPGTLDWLKLPAYDTEVVDGVSRGIDGPSGFGDRELGAIRSSLLAQTLRRLRPRLLLADHTPQGKHRELATALEQMREVVRPVCLLGVRGIVGRVAQAESPAARECFERYYNGLLWYGDSHVLGSGHPDRLARRFGVAAEECGYVSRLTELAHLHGTSPGAGRRSGCTVSIPWFGAKTEGFVLNLLQAVRRVGTEGGLFRFFIGDGASPHLLHLLETTPNCAVERFGGGYARALQESSTAVIFGGYNSLVDILGASLPALVVLRDMRDREQQEHLAALAAFDAGRIRAIEEGRCPVEELVRILSANLEEARHPPVGRGINLAGAEQAARIAAARL